MHAKVIRRMISEPVSTPTSRERIADSKRQNLPAPQALPRLRRHPWKPQAHGSQPIRLIFPDHGRFFQYGTIFAVRRIAR
jgi:hypothetical protein